MACSNVATKNTGQYQASIIQRQCDSIREYNHWRLLPGLAHLSVVNLTCHLTLEYQAFLTLCSGRCGSQIYGRNHVVLNSGTIMVTGDSNRHTPHGYGAILMKKSVWASGADHAFVQGAMVVTKPHIKTDVIVCEGTEGIIK